MLPHLTTQAFMSVVFDVIVTIGFTLKHVTAACYDKQTYLIGGKQVSFCIEFRAKQNAAVYLTSFQCSLLHCVRVLPQTLAGFRKQTEFRKKQRLKFSSRYK